MKKMLFFAAIALASLGSCTSDEFVGENKPNETNENYANAIVFGTGVKAVTRADKTGSDAATLLNNEFVFAGTKSDGTTAPTTFVFDQYVAKYVANTAHTTESNSSDWEYVSYTPATTSTLTDVTQTIKYWDYSKTQYDFAAYSLGTGTTKATATAIAAGNKSYTLQGTADQLKACYISDLVTAYNVNDVTNNIHLNDYGNPVQFRFRSLGAKIRLAFYETIPGYSVKDVYFYTSESADLATDGTKSDPTLFASSAVLPSGNGTMTITFPTTGLSNRNATDYNKAHVSFSNTAASDLSSTLVLEDLANLATAEKKETAGNFYLGRASNDATYAGGKTGEPAAGKYYTVLPYETGANLQLRIKYTLVSTDGSGETIDVDNATAVVPAELAKWNPNYAYTYIFKISDMTNGSTGVDGSGNVVTGLTPITLDAVVVDSEDGIQETITTVSKPSITTYMAGKVITSNDEYITGKTIYIIVNNGTSNIAYDAAKFKLYTVTQAASTDAGDEPAAKAAQPISEETVANALANGTPDDSSSPTSWTVKDANKWKMTVTTSNLLGTSTKIEAADSPTGNEISVNGAKFTPSSAGNYVFEYTIAAIGYPYIAATGTYIAGTKYYTDDTGATEVDTTEFVEGTTDVSSYFVVNTSYKPAEKYYKIIKVVAG